MRKTTYFLTSLAALMLLGSCHCPGRSTQSVNCTKQGSHWTFLAKFDNETVGALPSPSAWDGPPGASLNISALDNSVEVVNSSELGSTALKMTRGFDAVNLQNTIVEAVAGDLGDAPYTSGVYYLEFRAHGEIVPTPEIAGNSISVKSAEGKYAFYLRLFDGVYHLYEGDSYIARPGSYDPSQAHTVHIELNLDTRRYSICIDEVTIANNKPFYDDTFVNLYSLEFISPVQVTEAHENIYIIDDIRIAR